MIRLPTVIAIACCVSGVAHAKDATIRAGDRDRASIPNCNDTQVLPCFELVWVEGSQFKMTFFDLDVQTNPPTHNFYVMAPQTRTPQGIAPFLHDHVVGGDEDVYWHGFFAICSAQGISSGACVTPTPEGALPLARTVNGHKLTTAEAIESAASAGLIDLVDTGAVLLAKVDRCGDHR